MDRQRISGCTLADPTGPCNYASAGEISGQANSIYNALEVSLKKRFSHDLSFLASYTLSKTVDDASTLNITGSGSALNNNGAGANIHIENNATVSLTNGGSIHSLDQARIREIETPTTLPGVDDLTLSVFLVAAPGDEDFQFDNVRHVDVQSF